LMKRKKFIRGTLGGLGGVRSLESTSTSKLEYIFVHSVKIICHINCPVLFVNFYSMLVGQHDPE
jgi:hypothetical protein